MFLKVNYVVTRILRTQTVVSILSSNPKYSLFSAKQTLAKFLLNNQLGFSNILLIQSSYWFRNYILKMWFLNQ